ncbi:MAG: tetratricopeptide repeat protein [Cytophagaceae bacterium]
MIKRLFLPLVLVIFMHAGYAQQEAVTHAVLYHQSGEFDKAKEKIDLATLDEKTKVQAKTWYYKGLIYADLATSANPAFKALSQDPLKESYEALLKAKELDPAKGEYYKQSERKLDELWGEAINTGGVAYENNKYDDAIKNFELAQKMKPADTTAYVYAMWTAEDMKRNDLLKKYAEGLLSNNYKSVYIYQKLMQMAAQEKDYNKALEISKKGLADFPQNVALMQDQGEYYVKTGNTQGALENFEYLASVKPSSIEYNLYAGSMNEKLDKDDRAIQYYNKVLALDPSNVTANFNMASIYYNKGKEVLDRVNANSNIHSHHTTGKETEKEGKDFLLKSYDYASASYKASKEDGDKKDATDMMDKINKALNRKAPEGEVIHK